MPGIQEIVVLLTINHSDCTSFGDALRLLFLMSISGDWKMTENDFPGRQTLEHYGDNPVFKLRRCQIKILAVHYYSGQQGKLFKMPGSC